LTQDGSVTDADNTPPDFSSSKKNTLSSRQVMAMVCGLKIKRAGVFMLWKWSRQMALRLKINENNGDSKIEKIPVIEEEPRILGDLLHVGI
jgi:hypothetical protein